MKRVLVIDANQRSALAVVRSLGKFGIWAATADDSPVTLAGNSRYSQQSLQYPSPQYSPSEFIDVLTEIVTQYEINILLPMTELTTELLLQNKALFSDVAIPFSDINTVESLANKCTLMHMAERLGIPVPKTKYIESIDSVINNLEQLNYPLVLKPGKSWLFHENLWRRAAVQFANNATEAKEILENEWAFKACPFMLQENVAGQGAGIFAIYNQGNAIALFSHRRIREKPPSGGVSVLSESVDVDPLLSEYAQKLLEEVHWHGVAMVEFKVAPDGTPYLMEINTRFWGSLQLAVDAGINFPVLLYKLACNQKPDPVNHYRKGIRLRWLLGDLDNLYLTLRDKNLPLKSKIKSSLGFFSPLPTGTKHEINRIDDLKPAWHELKQYIRDLIK